MRMMLITEMVVMMMKIRMVMISEVCFGDVGGRDDDG